MDNSETKPKINKGLIESIKGRTAFTIDGKWSTVKVNCLSSSSMKKEKAYALNHFLNTQLLEKDDKEIFSLRSSTINSNLYKYRVIFNDQQNIKYASYSEYHSILATLVIDLPKVENEHPVVSSLRDNYNELIKFSEDKEQTSIEFLKATKEHYRLYKNMLKHILVSDRKLSKILDIDSLKEVGKPYMYSIQKK